MNTVVETINTAGRAFVDFSLPMLIQSSVLIVILLAVDAILRRKVRAVFRYWIWMLVLVKLMLPPSLGSPVSFGAWFGDALEVPTTVLFEPGPPQAMEPHPTVSAILSSPDPVISQPLTPPTSIAPSEAEKPIASETNGVAGASLDWRGLVLVVWSAVVIALTLLLVQRAFFVRGLIGQATEGNPALLSELGDCRRCLGLRQRVGLRLSPNATSPAVCGLLRPVILIPQTLVPRLQSHDLQAVLLHELAHVKRGDLWINLVQTLLQIANFYNPLLWLANVMIRRTREQAVDETVLVTMGETAQQYPETLVNIARLAFTRRATLSLRLIGVVESKSALTARIKHILSRPLPKTARLGAISLLAVLVLAAVLLPMAKAQQNRAEEAFSRFGVLPNCGVWLSDIARQDLPVLDLASDEIIELPAVKNEREFLTTTETKGKGDILYYFDKTKNAARITFLRRAGLGGEPLSKEYETVTVTPMEIPFETTVTTQGGRFRLRIIRTDGQACSIQFHPLNDSRPAFKAILAEGITAELLGVREYPGEGKNWWRPDGSPLPEAPLPEKGATNLHPPGGEAAYEVAVRLDHGSNGGLAGIYIPSSGNESNRGGNYGAKYDLGWATGVFPKSQKSCSVRCLVMTGPWETAARVSVKALGSRSMTIAGVTFCEAGEDPNEGATITAFYDFPNHRCDIRAVTKDGRVVDATGHDSGGYGGRHQRSTVHFRGLALAEIEEFEFRTRPWTWIEFKNSSLRPGQHTNVEVHDDLAENRVGEAEILLPDADGRPVVLDLLRGELVPLPPGPEPQKVQQALREMGKGDIIYDVDSGDCTLILLRDAASEQVQEDTGELGVKGHLINPQRLPETLTITTAEGRRYEVTILSADEDGCTLNYSPLPLDKGAGGGALVEPNETANGPGNAGEGTLFRVHGVVTDASGRPMAEVEVNVDCGFEKPRRADRAFTDENGRYTLDFKPAMYVADADSYGVGIQPAFVWTRKDGFYETSLRHKGNLALAGEKPGPEEQQFVADRAGVVLPHEPYELNFTMAPAARIEGILVDAQDKPLAAGRIGLLSRQMYPSNVGFALLRTDGDGRFTVEHVPCTSFQFSCFNNPVGQSSEIALSRPGTWRLNLKYRQTGQNVAELVVVDLETDERDSHEVRGQVLDPNGKPPIGAQVALCTKDKGVIVDAGRLVPTTWGSKTSEIVETDAQGRFSFPAKPDEFHLIAAHERGFVWRTSEELAASGDLRLEPWGRVEGILKIGRQAGADERVNLFNNIQKGAIGQNVRYDYQTQTDSAGRFVFEKVPPGWMEAGYMIRVGDSMSSYTSRTPIRLEPGQNMKMTLGGEGRPVIGRFVPPADYTGPIYFGSGLRAFATSHPELPQPDNREQMTQREQAQWRSEWLKTPQARAFYDAIWHDLSRRHYTFRIEDDGSFRIEDVIPGRYKFTVWLEERFTDQGRQEEIGGYYGTVEVPAMTEAYMEEPLDLGGLTLKMRNPPLHVGDMAPLFEARSLDGRDIRLIDHRGKFVLLSFWQPVFHPELDRLKDLHKTYGGAGKLAIIDLAGSDTLEEVRSYIDEHRIEWPEIYLGEKADSDIAKRYGDPVASYILLVNPEGKIIATWLRGEKLTQTVYDAMGGFKGP